MSLPDLLHVHGHPRSGNHYLAAMLHRHFFDDDPSLAIEVDPRNTGHWRRRAAERDLGLSRAPGALSYQGERVEGDERVAYGKLLGTHRLPPPKLTDLARSIYILRDGRDVALSLYAWKRCLPPGHEDIGLERYLARPIDWQGSPGFRAPAANALERPFEHWKRHIELWLATGVFWVRYEDLVRDPMRELVRIGQRFGLKVCAGVERMSAVGWNASATDPARALERIGKWRREMPSRSLALYDSLIPRDFVGRYEP